MSEEIFRGMESNSSYISFRSFSFLSLVCSVVARLFCRLSVMDIASHHIESPSLITLFSILISLESNFQIPKPIFDPHPERYANPISLLQNLHPTLLLLPLSQNSIGESKRTNFKFGRRRKGDFRL